MSLQILLENATTTSKLFLVNLPTGVAQFENLQRIIPKVAPQVNSFTATLILTAAPVIVRVGAGLMTFVTVPAFVFTRVTMLGADTERDHPR
jgi:hypothetical protein